MAMQPPVTMLELDRHLSQSLEQGRQQPVGVLRYGRPWVWIVPSDAWFDAARWSGLDLGAHPLHDLRRQLDPLLKRWRGLLRSDCLAGTEHDARAQVRALLLLHLQGWTHPQRVLDELSQNIAHRAFVARSQGSWSLAECEQLLRVLAQRRVQHGLRALCRRLPLVAPSPPPMRRPPPLTPPRADDSRPRSPHLFLSF